MRARRAILAPALALAALAALPAAAQGAATTVQVDNFDGKMRVLATAAEANRVTVSRTATQYVITDAGPGATTADAADCSVAAAVVSCNAAVVNEIEVSLADLNDTALIADSVPQLGELFENNIQVRGGAGSDTLTAASSANVELSGEADGDALTSAGGRDSVFGGDGADVMSGGEETDRMEDGPGADSVDAGPGNDNLGTHFQPDGPDNFVGGAGRDRLSFSNRSLAINLTANDVADDGEAGEGDNVSSDIENLTGGNGDDTVGGTAADNELIGNDGNDSLIGEGGVDELSGGSGNDIVDGGDGPDEVSGGSGGDQAFGGPGNDYIEEEFFDNATDVQSGGEGIDGIGGGGTLPLRITLDGVADDGFADPVISGGRDNAMPDIENAEGGEDDDTLIGNDSANELSGGDGSDTLTGLGGADALIAGDGADTLTAGAGIDTIEGGGGPDTLRSRDQGADALECGSSLDTLFGDSFDEVSADCDQVSLGVEIASKKASVDGGKVNLKASCPPIEPGGCDASFTLSAKNKVIAKGKKTIAAGKESKVKLKPTKAGRKQLDGKGSLSAIAGAEMTDADGNPVSSELKVKVAL